MDKNGVYVLITPDGYICNKKLNQGFPETTTEILNAYLFDYKGIELFVEKMAFVPESVQITYE